MFTKLKFGERVFLLLSGKIGISYKVKKRHGFLHAVRFHSAVTELTSGSLCQSNIFFHVFHYICHCNGLQLPFHRFLHAKQLFIQNIMDIPSHRAVQIWIFVEMK